MIIIDQNGVLLAYPGCIIYITVDEVPPTAASADHQVGTELFSMDQNQTQENTTADAGTDGRKRAPASNFLAIVRGRLPLLFVHAIRFDTVLNAMPNKDLAVKFGTSVGKVFDIKKGRNFSYVNAGWKPTNEDLAQAEAWIAQMGAQNAKGLTAVGDKTLAQTTLDAYRERGLASAEEAAAFAATRTSSRAKASPASDEGNAAQAGASGSADALLS